MFTRGELKMKFLLRTKLLTALILLVVLVFGNTLRVFAQTPASDLKGKSNEVLLIPNSTVNAGEIIFHSDRDHDGMSDEDEARNGTNPDDPSDADGDLDGDGLSNGDEVAKGTNPNAVDSDGDGVSDAEEIRLGYNPLDAGNTPPPNTAITTLQVSPNPLALSVNSVFGSTPAQLTVTGITNTGTSVDLTHNANTVYQSLDQSIAAVSATGEAFGISVGSTTIQVQNGGLTASTAVNVGTFDPSAVSVVQIPGYANNVDVAGNYAYVAAGSAGLQIVDITNRSNPQIVGALDTSGNANDIRVVGDFAYLADGESGLEIINISNPSNPVLAGSFDTPGEANDVVLVGTTAYVADGLSGLQIIDVADPSNPQIIGALDTPGKTRGVDVSGNYAILAEGAPSIAIRVVDITNPSDPQLIGTLSQFQEVIDVVARGNFAYVAGWPNGLKVVDFSDPAAPIVASTDPFGFSPRDVTLNGDFLMVAETVLLNFVPLYSVADPATLDYRGGIDQSNLGNADTTGIASDDQFIYTTGVPFISGYDKGVVSNFGPSSLFISRYRLPAGDSNGVAPTVSLTSPVEGDTVREGKTLELTATASDDVYVGGVQFKVNGNVVATDSNSPYQFTYDVPLNSTSLSITATAFDLGNNVSTTPPVSVTVTPDAPPSVSITDPAENTTLIEGESIILRAEAADDEAVTQVRFSANGTELDSAYNSPYEIPTTVPTGINSLTITAEAHDTVDRTTTDTRTYNVIPDPNTIVTGRVLKTNGQPVENAEVTVFENFTAQTAANGTFSISNVPTIRGSISAKATALLNNVPAANLSLRFVPVRGGTTNVGDIKLAAGATAPTALSVGFFGSRDDNIFSGQDLFVAYNDRLSSVYSFNGTDFAPRTVEQMETGAVVAGNSNSVSLLNFFGNRTFLQLAGQPGTITEFNADQRENITQAQIPTLLESESQFISRGYDYSHDRTVTAFLSNNQPGGAVIKFKSGNEEPVDVPLPPGLVLHSLVVNDIDSNGYADILAIKELPGGGAKLISISRTSSNVPQQLTGDWDFAPLIESDIIDRVANPSNGLNNLVVGNFANANGREIAVLGDDRIRIYTVSPTGEFVIDQEMPIPAGEVPTGIYAYALRRSSFTDLLVTTQKAINPEAHSLFVLLNSDGGGGGCGSCTSLTSGKNDKGKVSSPSQQLFDAPTVRNYTISNSNGDSRIFVGNWGGAFNQLDVVVVEGDEVKIFLDVTPRISGS
jgi:hypothetical protein